MQLTPLYNTTGEWSVLRFCKGMGGWGGEIMTPAAGLNEEIRTHCEQLLLENIK